MTYEILRICAPILSVAALLAADPAVAAGVSAGTLIENTASASYTTGGATLTVDSNTVVVQVDELLDVTLASQDSGAKPISSGSAFLTYELTNIGNGPEAFLLTADPAVAGNDFDVTITGIAYDVDGNGEYDPAIDIMLGAGAATPVIAADGALTIFVFVTPPAGVTNGQSSKISLNADAVTGTGTVGTTFAGEGQDGSDAVVGTTGADADSKGSLIAAVVSVALVKSASIADPFGGHEAVPGAVISYTILATVSGSGSVAGLHVTDAFPDGTTYAPGTLALDAAGLTDASDSDAGAASSAGIDVLIGEANAGSAFSVTFNVAID